MAKMFPSSFSERRVERPTNEEDEDEDQSEEEDCYPSFKIGVDSSQEQLSELQFSLRNAHNQLEAGVSNSQCQELIAQEIQDLASQERRSHQSDPYTGPPALLEDSFQDNEKSPFGFSIIQRLDSRDVVFDNRVKVKVLRQYVIGDKLGEGSYAKVKEAIDKTTLCRRAIKIMKKCKLDRMYRCDKSVKEEIRLMYKLKHENVIQLIETFEREEKQKIYIVMEYCCAVLNQMLEKSEYKKFPVWQAHFYFKQLIEGVTYLHSQGVVHKDIKPSNLLLNTAGVLKICDFGVAEILDMSQGTDEISQSQGTPLFQPPELAVGIKKFSGFKLDVWCCGVTLFNFVTGDYPFSGETIYRLFEVIAICNVIIPEDVDPVLTDFLLGLLTKDFTRRFSIQDIRSHDWFKKKHPRTAPPITISSPDGANPTNSSTVIPYLCEFHYGTPELYDSGGLQIEVASNGFEGLNYDEKNEHEITKKDVKPELVPTSEETSEEDTEEKTTRCIKVRKPRDCVVT